jgi:RNA polymerase sigma-70 factor, ECF subfamily
MERYKILDWLHKSIYLLKICKITVSAINPQWTSNRPGRMLHWFHRRRQKAKSYRSNREWVQKLAEPPDSQALQELRQILVRGLRSSLAAYVDRERDQFVEDIAQDSLLRILKKLDTFKGESGFVAWAMKIAVREGMSELRRKKWRDVSLEDLSGGNEERPHTDLSGAMASTVAGPDQQAHESMILAAVMEMMEKELSEKQKKAIDALMVKQIPMTVVADSMGMSRNALYKLIHDARMKLRKKLMESGMDPEEMLREL